MSKHFHYQLAFALSCAQETTWAAERGNTVSTIWIVFAFWTLSVSWAIWDKSIVLFDVAQWRDDLSDPTPTPWG